MQMSTTVHPNLNLPPPNNMLCAHRTYRTTEIMQLETNIVELGEKLDAVSEGG